tara:strand:- start:1225 stop:1479 length:255 start_codon:yes stop_codon:yes gene_type:complete
LFEGLKIPAAEILRFRRRDETRRFKTGLFKVRPLVAGILGQKPYGFVHNLLRFLQNLRINAIECIGNNRMILQENGIVKNGICK